VIAARRTIPTCGFPFEFNHFSLSHNLHKSRIARATQPCTSSLTLLAEREVKPVKEDNMTPKNEPQETGADEHSNEHPLSTTLPDPSFTGRMKAGVFDNRFLVGSAKSLVRSEQHDAPQKEPVYGRWSYPAVLGAMLSELAEIGTFNSLSISDSGAELDFRFPRTHGSDLRVNVSPGENGVDVRLSGRHLSDDLELNIPPTGFVDILGPDLHEAVSVELRKALPSAARVKGLTPLVSEPTESHAEDASTRKATRGARQPGA
jgi:hypothetical protein